MKRSTSRALVAVLAAALALSGAVSVAAKDHPGKSGTHGAHAGVTKVGVVKTPSLTTKGNASHPGGVFRVLAIVKAAPADRPATVDAIVNFASGPATVVLTQSGGGSAYHANVPVPAAEPAGVVVINATAIVAGQTLTATGTGKIVIEDTTQAPLAPASPATAESPATCTSPGTGESPEASDAPEAPEASDAAETPEASDAPEASKAPDADQNSEDCQSEGAGVPLSADTIAKIIAFLQTLFA
jgi:nicotinate-nucleotide--dimethylbenzimidazole phosphoribosyltransferase